MRRPRIAASILAADLLRFGEDGTAAFCRGADLLHVDVMDPSCASRLAPGRLARAAGRIPLEVHLLARPVDALVPMLARAGANAIIFHPEESEDVRRSVARAKEHGCKAGLALNPATPLCVLDGVLGEIDLVLVMSASPGSAAARFDASALRKIRGLRRLIDFSERHVVLAVDGGVCAGVAAEVVEAGADTLVAGAFGPWGWAGTFAALEGGLAAGPRRVAGGIA